MAERFQADGEVILVAMSVDRFRVHQKDRVVECWGRVGDYEVMVVLPLDDPQMDRMV